MDDNLMDFAKRRDATAREKTHGKKRWKSRELPTDLLVGLRKVLMRLEPEFCQLVRLYDEVAAWYAEQAQSPVAAVYLLDEAWCEKLGVPSEVDIRAAAVRLFASEGRAPAWLRRRVSHGPLVSARAHDDPVDRHSAAPFHNGSCVQLRQQELVGQYTRAAEACQQLLDLCSRVERILDRIKNLSARSAEQERLKIETGVGLEDVTAAATRLRLRHHHTVGI